MKNSRLINTIDMFIDDYSKEENPDFGTLLSYMDDAITLLARTKAKLEENKNENKIGFRK